MKDGNNTLNDIDTKKHSITAMAEGAKDSSRAKDARIDKINDSNTQRRMQSD